MTEEWTVYKNSLWFLYLSECMSYLIYCLKIGYSEWIRYNPYVKTIGWLPFISLGVFLNGNIKNVSLENNSEGQLEIREHYQLEILWTDADSIAVNTSDYSTLIPMWFINLMNIYFYCSENNFNTILTKSNNPIRKNSKNEKDENPVSSQSWWMKR